MSHRQDRGSALIMAVFMLALITSMGVALIFMSTTEVRSSTADTRSKQVYYLAEAGMEAGRATLLILNGPGTFTDDLTTYAGADGVLDFDPDALQVTRDVLGNVTGLAGYDDDVPLIPPTPFGDGWYAAFMTNDAVNGTSPTDTNDRVVITGVGMGPDNTLEVVQAVIIRETMIPPAAITMLGPNPSFIGGASNPKLYMGEDCNGAPEGIPGYYAPLVGLTSSTAEALAESGIGSNTAYSSGPYVGDQAFADLTDSTEPTYQGPLDTVWTTCQELHDKIEQIRLVADVLCTDGSSCTLPAPATDNVVLIDDDYSLNSDGAGLIIVTGQFVVNGGVTWEGMMWAIGEGYYRRNGAGSGVTAGSIVIADIAGPDGIYGTADDCTGGDGGFASPSFDENGGGTGDTMYCSDDIWNAAPAFPYEIVQFRQM
ncbi:MAG: hypothetical protein GTN83_08485 [Acidobacteria bacterium]|nr:hypothetical protein [Acidobacteriota bacterium]